MGKRILNKNKIKPGRIVFHIAPIPEDHALRVIKYIFVDYDPWKNKNLIEAWIYDYDPFPINISSLNKEFFNSLYFFRSYRAAIKQAKLYKKYVDPSVNIQIRCTNHTC